jgi:predicted RNase H-like nuclease
VVSGGERRKFRTFFEFPPVAAGVTAPPFVGVDGTPDGWLAVRYDRDGFRDVRLYDDPERLWRDNDGAETVLIDVPIGLAENRAARAPERAARDLLGPRSGSVFNVPIRRVLEFDDYGAANAAQREAIGKGLQKQTFNLVPKIRAVDRLLTDGDASQDVLREAHPEVCFRALAGGEPMASSKTGQPAAAFWERVDVLAGVDPGFRDALFAAGETVADRGAAASNDDLLDAFALAVTASDLTGDLQTLPHEPARDAEGLRMEMVYAEP